VVDPLAVVGRRAARFSCRTLRHVPQEASAFMPKLKTKKAAARRFEYTGSGKLVRTRHGKSHLRRNRSKRAAREYAEMMPVSSRDLKRVLRLMPYAK
jgi:large subunit ribosomal protein L35